MDYMITTKQLTKKYKSFSAVNNVSLNIPKGSIYGLLGPNGAGKSTTMKMLLGLTAPTTGSFLIDGKHFPDDRLSILKEVGSFIESPSFYANLTGAENLDIIRRILGLSQSAATDALELVGLSEFGGRLAKKYSLGMKQRLGLAGALLGRPPVLILDEPTGGLDPGERVRFRNLLSEFAHDRIVLISTHIVCMWLISSALWVWLCWCSLWYWRRWLWCFRFLPIGSFLRRKDGVWRILGQSIGGIWER